MTDITKCHGEAMNYEGQGSHSIERNTKPEKYKPSKHICPLRDTCKRYRCKGSDYQSYMIGVPYKVEEKSCEHFYEENI